MLSVRKLGVLAVALGLLACMARTEEPHAGPIDLRKPQPRFALNPVQAPDLGDESVVVGNAILIEDRGMRGNSPKRAPVTVARTFVEGEFAECVQAAVRGVPVETQCDVKTRWPNGSLRHAVVSFWAELDDRAHAQIDFLPAPCGDPEVGLTRQQMLDFLGGAWDAMLTASASLDGSQPLDYTVRAREILERWDGVENPTGVRYWLRGPIVTQILIEDRSPGLPHDFGWSSSLRHIRSGAEINATATTIPVLADDLELARSWKYPLIVTMMQEAIAVCGLEGTRLQVCPGGRGVLDTRPSSQVARRAIVPSQGWSKAAGDAHRSLHPVFAVTFYPGWNGVKVETVVENVWLDRIQDQQYRAQIRLGTSGAEPVFDRAILHHTGTRWRKTFWQGHRPSPLRIDHNTPYLIRSRVVPNYDLSFRLDETRMRQELTRFSRSDQGEPMGVALWQPTMWAAGGRLDIGVLPGWYVMYLHTWDPGMQDLVEGMASASASAPAHWREPAGSERVFEPYHNTPAAGRVLSVDARPTFFGLSGPPFQRSETVPAERGVAVGPTYNSLWNVDDAHQPGMVYLPYALTGDWYLLDELHFWSSLNVSLGDPGNCHYCSFGPLGMLAGQSRGQAWTLRNLAHTVAMTPEGTPERTYFYAKLQNNIALFEGQFDIRDGHFYEPAPDCSAPCLHTRWRIGRDLVARGRANPLHFWEKGSSGLLQPENMNVETTGGAGSPWMMNFVHAALAVTEEMGFGEVTPLRRAMAANLISQLQHPDYNPYLVAAYRIPILDRNFVFFPTWKDVFDQYLPNMKSRSAFSEVLRECADCYAHIAKATSSWMVGITTPDGLSGTAGYLFMQRELPVSRGVRADPTWTIVSRAPVAGLNQARLRAPSWYKPDYSRLALQRQ